MEAAGALGAAAPILDSILNPRGALSSFWAPSWFIWEILELGLIFALTLIFGLDEHTSTHFFVY